MSSYRCLSASCADADVVVWSGCEQCVNPGDAGDPAPVPIEPTSGHMRCGDKVIDVGVGKRSVAEVWVSPREIRDFLLGGRRASLVR